METPSQTPKISRHHPVKMAPRPREVVVVSGDIPPERTSAVAQGMTEVNVSAQFGTLHDAEGPLERGSRVTLALLEPEPHRLKPRRSERDKRRDESRKAKAAEKRKGADVRSGRARKEQTLEYLMSGGELNPGPQVPAPGMRVVDFWGVEFSIPTTHSHICYLRHEPAAGKWTLFSEVADTRYTVTFHYLESNRTVQCGYVTTADFAVLIVYFPTESGLNPFHLRSQLLMSGDVEPNPGPQKKGRKVAFHRAYSRALPVSLYVNSPQVHRCVHDGDALSPAEVECVEWDPNPRFVCQACKVYCIEDSSQERTFWKHPVRGVWKKVETTPEQRMEPLLCPTPEKRAKDAVADMGFQAASAADAVEPSAPPAPVPVRPFRADLDNVVETDETYEQWTDRMLVECPPTPDSDYVSASEPEPQTPPSPPPAPMDRRKRLPVESAPPGPASQSLSETLRQAEHVLRYVDKVAPIAAFPPGFVQGGRSSVVTPRRLRQAHALRSPQKKVPKVLDGYKLQTREELDKFAGLLGVPASAPFTRREVVSTDRVVPYVRDGRIAPNRSVKQLEEDIVYTTVVFSGHRLNTTRIAMLLGLGALFCLSVAMGVILPYRHQETRLSYSMHKTYPYAAIRSYTIDSDTSVLRNTLLTVANTFISARNSAVRRANYYAVMDVLRCDTATVSAVDRVSSVCLNVFLASLIVYLVFLWDSWFHTLGAEAYSSFLLSYQVEVTYCPHALTSFLMECRPGTDISDVVHQRLLRMANLPVQDVVALQVQRATALAAQASSDETQLGFRSAHETGSRFVGSFVL